MMEPPGKRLRILQSVEMDETKPDYIAAKQKQQEKFKGRLEKLFAKYGSMHESMSDEIDFKTGKLVVDRGHLRRVQRQMKRKGPGLLDSLLEPQSGQDCTPDNGEGQAESEDELAPTQTRKRKRDSAGHGEEVAQSPGQHNMALVTSSSQAAPTAAAQENAPQIPNTPNPTANLLQQIQQTPLGQQAQAALIANLNQTIAQAVQQAVAPLLSILQATPNGQAAHAPIFPVPSPLPVTDNVRPAADPKWYFPPISVVKEASRIEYQRSSPPVMKEPPPQTMNRNEDRSPLVPRRRRSPKVLIERRRGITTTKQGSHALDASVGRPQSSHSLPELCRNANFCPDVDPVVDDSLNCKAKGAGSAHEKYHFTEEDDVYINKRKELHNMTFKEIRASKAKWLDWPISAFSNRWNARLKDKKLHLRDTSRTGSIAQHDASIPPEHEEHFFSSIEIPETSSASHHLPTPSSLGQEDNHNERAMVPSSSHFDDDELELLSLAGADITAMLPTHTSHYEDDTYPTPDEPLPSIEGAEFRNEDELQLEMLKFEESPTPEPIQSKVLLSTIPETQESVVSVSSPTQKRTVNQKPKPKPMVTHRAASDSSDDLDIIGANDEPTTPHTYIKRESLTPQATRVLCSSPAIKTPRPIPQSLGMTAKSTGKLDRRAYLKEVKQSWARGKGKTPGSQKRRSLNVLPMVRKKVRVDVEVGDSEDELAG